VIDLTEDEYPPFKEGDLIRCQKFENGDIKYYDAVVASKLNTYSYVIITAGSVFDVHTVVEYNDDGTIKTFKEELNKTQYSKTKQTSSQDLPDDGTSLIESDGFQQTSLLAVPAADDSLVRIGHLYDRNR
jgi:hypothetical protein